MFKKIVFGSLLAAVAVFLWGWFFWGVLAMRFQIMQPLPTNLATNIVAGVQEEIRRDGVYFHPLPEAESSYNLDASIIEEYRRGPILELYVRRSGIEPYNPVLMAVGLLHLFVLAIFSGSLLAWLADRLNGFGSRVGLVFCLGLFSVLWSQGNDVIWFHQVVDFNVLESAYTLTAWLIGGLILAAVIKMPRTVDVTGGQYTPLGLQS